MTYRIPLPSRDSESRTLDIVEPNSTAVQRFLRRDGLAAYEPATVAALLALFDQQPDGFVFFDVGANMGLYALLCAALFEPSAVHAFEPTPSTAQVARKITKANGFEIEVIEAALSNEDGCADLHFSTTSDASNSLVEGFKENSGAVTVQTLRLDEHVRRSGVAPNVIKIDVETFEPQVLAGAAHTIAEARPYIVIEVLNRRGYDHGRAITAAMAPFGYFYYRLEAEPTWIAESAVSGTAGSKSNDWLLAPYPVPFDFAENWDSWKRLAATCGPERNSRVPIGRSIVVAAKRGGIREVLATAQRYAVSRRRQRGQRPS